MPTLEHGGLGAINQIAKQGKHALKDKAGGSLDFGIVDDGSGKYNMTGRGEWEGEEGGRDEHCHPVKLLSVLDFIWKGLGWWASSLIHPLVRPIRSAAPETALKIWPTYDRQEDKRNSPCVVWRVQNKGGLFSVSEI